MTTATTIWVLILTAPGGLTANQGWYWSQEQCLEAGKIYAQSQYYQAECRTQQHREY
jgi:hypothetical protein